jgi:hypothetical protein
MVKQTLETGFYINTSPPQEIIMRQTLRIGMVVILLLLVANLLASVPVSSQAQAGSSFISPLSSPLSTPSPAPTLTPPSKWAQQALNHVAARHNVPLDKLLIVNEHERTYPFTDRKFRAFTVLDTRTPQSPSYSFLIEITTGKIEEDVAAVRAAEDTASSKKYGKLQPALYDRLQQVNDTTVLPIAIWLAPRSDQRTVPQVYVELAARFPKAAQALAKGGKPFDVADPALAERIRQAHEQMLAEDVLTRTQPVMNWLMEKKFAITSYAGMPSVAARLPKWAILALANRDDVAMIYLTEEQGFNTMDIAASTDRVPAVWQRGVDGTGQRVAILESNNVSSSCSNVVATRTGRLGSGEDPNHMTRVANIVGCNADPYRGIAYGAQIVSAGYDATGWPGSASQQDAVAALAWAISSPQNARVVNLSYKWEIDNEMNWMDRVFDYWARQQNVTLVIATGNNDDGTHRLGSPAKAWNVITVGGSDDNGTTDWNDDLMAGFSSYVDPTSGPNGHGDREKPEVVAPAVAITAPGANGNIDAMNGTSFAAPQVSGLATLLMSRNTWLTVWPEAVKAIIMASAIHNIDGPSDIPSYQDLKDGAGAIDADLADTIAKTRQDSGVVCNDPCWWGVITSDTNPTVGGSVYQYFTASQGERIRVAIAWFASADIPPAPPSLPWDLLLTNYQLYVYKPSGGDPISYTASWDNNYELADFVAPETGQYQIRIYRQPEGDYNEQSNSIGIAWVTPNLYHVFLSGVMNNYTTELIKNGTFDAGGTYWTTTTSYPSCTNPPIFGTIDGNNAAVLARCTYNTDTLSQTITIPANVTSAQLTFKFRVEQNYSQPIYNDRLYVRIRDRTTGELVPLSSYDDSPPRSVWRSGVSADLTARRGHTLDVIFSATNDNDLRATKFWIDDVSLQIAY